MGGTHFRGEHISCDIGNGSVKSINEFVREVTNLNQFSHVMQVWLLSFGWRLWP